MPAKANRKPKVFKNISKRPKQSPSKLADFNIHSEELMIIIAAIFVILTVSLLFIIR